MADQPTIDYQVEGAPFMVETFDVIVTDNLFGDMLSDVAAMLTGSLGMLPSASLNAQNYGMYEPIHGSAPDIAGQGLANPIACVLSAAMMLDHLGEKPAHDAIIAAIEDVLRSGETLTADMGGRANTEEMTQAIVDRIGSDD